MVVVLATLAALMSFGVATATAPAAKAATAVAGTPAAPRIVYNEDFENGMGTTQSLLTAYTGATPAGQKYTADPAWLTGCNGEIVEFNTPVADLGNCTATGDAEHTRQLAYALGVHAGDATPETNHAVTAYTEGNPGANATEFQTVTPIPLSADKGHFLTFRVDGAAQNCAVSAPLYNFSFLNGTVATPVGGTINACSGAHPEVMRSLVEANGGHVGSYGADPYTARFEELVSEHFGEGSRVHPVLTGTGANVAALQALVPRWGAVVCADTAHIYTDEGGAPERTTTVDVPASGTLAAGPIAVGTYTSNGSALFTGASAGIQMTNANGSGAGNDAAFDNIQILDATPALDKSFSPTTVSAGAVSTLTFTVTNTSELAAKNGWSFTDSLPTGLQVANPATQGGTCNATTGATAGGTSIAVTKGNLTAGEASCTITVQVTPTTTGTFTNGPDNVTETGLTPPPPAILTATGGPAWTCSAFGYLFQSPTNNTGAHSIYQVDLVSGASKQVASTVDNVNGVGYNTLDNYMYGYDGANGQLVKIAADGTLEHITALPAGVSYQVGDFDNAGHLYLMQGGNGTGAWLEIDLAPGSATYGQTIASGTATVPATASNLPSDWVYVNGSLYGLSNPNTGATQHLLAFNATTHAMTDLGAVAGTAGADTYGAGYADATGNLYFGDNQSGAIIRINPTTKASIPLSTGPVSAGNDGARCASAPIPTVTVTKTVEGRAADADQFTVGLNQAAKTLTAATTTGTDTTATTTNWPVSQGTTYTVTDAMAAGSTDALSAYTATVVCTDGDGNTLTTGGSKGAWTFTVPGGDAYTCNVTNSPTGSIGIVKHAGTPVDVNKDGITDAGDTIQYTFTVTNTGTSPLTSVGVTDAKAGTVSCPTPILGAGVIETCTADAPYTITAADVTAGSVDNTATAHGTPPGATTPVGSTPSTTTTPTVTPAPALTVVKSADPSSSADFTPGQKITYNFVVTNTGNVPMNDITINEGDFTGTGTMSAAVCPDPTLAVGAQEVCTATYTLTSADVDSGSVTNTATAEGTPPGSDTPTPSEPSTVVVPTPPAPGITVVKTATPATVTKVGQTVDYSFLVTNTGNVTLQNVTVDEGAFSGTGTVSAIDCPTTTLAAGQFETCTATYKVTQADVDSGKLTNTATADGTPPGSDTPIPPSDPSTSTVTITPAPSLTVVKTADVQATKAGQTVTYSFLVTNTGNVTITDPTVTDSGFTGTGTLSAITCPTDAAPLASGDTETCTATYTVTQADVNAGALSNTATVTGTTPGGGPTPPSDPSTVKIPTNPHPALTVVKTANTTIAKTVGQVITYTFAIHNTGNVTITSPTVNDSKFSGTGTLSAITCPTDTGAGTLAPGASENCAATYKVTSADLSSGKLTNTATVSGTTPGGDPIGSTPSTVTLTTVVPVVPAGLAFTGSNAELPLLAGTAATVLGIMITLGVAYRRRRRVMGDPDAADGIESLLE